jgi:hypothetical protein
VHIRFLVAVFTILSLPASGRAADVRLRWVPSPDTRVRGYNVYVREATRPYGAPRDAGAGSPGSDGSLAWTLTGLSATATYFVAVSAYTADRLESALSNELAIGAPDPCVEDVCTSPTSCTVRPLPDGAPCGASGVASCGATCLAGVCSGPADRSMTIDRLKVKRGPKDMRITAKGWFPTSALFDPLSAGLELTLVGASGEPVVQAHLYPSDLDVGPTGEVIKLVRRRDDTSAIRVRRLVMRVRDDDTLVKALVVASPPPAMPTAAGLTLQSGSLCLSAQSLDCSAGSRALSCR